MNYQSQIKELHSSGKTYKQIARTLGCSEWTVHYNLNPNRKRNQDKYTKKKQTTDPLFYKRKEFLRSSRKNVVVDFSLLDLKKKLGTSPICYLTGEPINLLDKDDFSLDHILPASRGGESSLSNLAITKKIVNQAKFNMTPQEFIEMCLKVTNHSKVVPPGVEPR